MPTITATVASTGDYYDYRLGNTSIEDNNYTKYTTTSGTYQKPVIRKVMVPRKPTLDEILFDDDLNKFEEVEVEVNWPNYIDDWKEDQERQDIRWGKMNVKYQTTSG